MKFDTSQLDTYPLDPGVYLMKNGDGKVVYVGKAKSLKKRLKQYFFGRDDRAIIPILLEEIERIDTIVVNTEKEALLLENTLIKKHQPKFNALLKDDKTFISLMINHHHPWPRVKLIRYKGKPKEKGLYFGPYTSAYAARQTFDLITQIFPLRQCSDQELKKRTRPCLLYGIKRCIAPCVDLCTKEEYDTFVEGVIKFLKGQDQEILQKLYREMEKASEELAFEKAASILNTIKQIEHVTHARQMVAKTKGEDIDALAIYRQADESIIMQLIFRQGKLIGSEHYSFSHPLENEEELFSSFILQYYRKTQDLPKQILVAQSLKQASSLEEILEEEHHKKIAIIHPVKGEKKHLVQLAEKNAKATFNQEKDQQEIREKMLLDLAETLDLERFPSKIECFDTSNISGTDLVASMVRFVDGIFDRANTRTYIIKGIDKPDDYAALHQVLSRRLIRMKEEDNLPDLILIDGGKGQLNIAKKVLKELDIANVDAISLSKEEGKHDKGLRKEKIFILDKPEPLLLPSASPLLFLLQQIRDKAHEKAISFHRKRRQKRTLTSSLQSIPGIGPVKQKRLLKTFGSLKRILAASDEDLLQVKGITKRDIERLRLN